VRALRAHRGAGTTEHHWRSDSINLRMPSVLGRTHESGNGERNLPMVTFRNGRKRLRCLGGSVFGVSPTVSALR